MTKEPLELVWEEPPPAPSRNAYGPVIEQLKMKPNEWARIRVTETSGGAYSTRKSLVAAANGATVETRVVPTGDGKKHALYARYVPKGRATPK